MSHPKKHTSEKINETFGIDACNIVHSHCNIRSIMIYFCNIYLKHLKHMFGRVEHCTARSGARSAVEKSLGQQLPGRGCALEGAGAWPEQGARGERHRMRRATGEVWQQQGGVGARCPDGRTPRSCHYINRTKVHDHLIFVP
jgi:hypothetical protein